MSANDNDELPANTPLFRASMPPIARHNATTQIVEFIKTHGPLTDLSLRSEDMLDRYFAKNPKAAKELQKALTLDDKNPIHALSQQFAIAYVSCAASAFEFTHTYANEIRRLTRQQRETPAANLNQTENDILILSKRYMDVFCDLLQKTHDLKEHWDRQQPVWDALHQMDQPENQGNELTARQQLIGLLTNHMAGAHSAMGFANKSRADQTLALLQPMAKEITPIQCTMNAVVAPMPIHEAPKLIELTLLANQEITKAQKAVSDMLEQAKKEKSPRLQG